MPDGHPTLEGLLEAAWEGIVRGCGDRRHGFHLPTVATVDGGGRPQARVVVLRAADRAAGTLSFHTDRRSTKLDELAAGVAWVLYDARRRLQVRASGPAGLDEAAADARWAASTLSARKCYLVDSAPGTAVDAWTSGHVGRLDGVAVPTVDEVVAGRENFAVITTRIETLEVLRIARAGHQRARFERADGWGGSWLVP